MILNQIFIFFTFYLLVFYAGAQENAPLSQVGLPLPRVNATIVDDLGKVADFSAEKKLEIVWMKKEVLETPVFVLQMQVPDGWTFRKETEKTLVTSEKFLLTKKSTVEKVFVKAPNTSGQLYNLVIELIPSETYLLVHDSCIKNGLSLLQEDKTEPLLLVGIRCFKNPNGENAIGVYFLDDATFEEASFEKELKTLPDVRIFKAVIPAQESIHTNQKVGTIELESKEFKQSNSFDIFVTATGAPPIDDRRVSFSAGISGTQLSYTQSPISVDLNQAALTLKLGSIVQIIRNKFDFGLSGYVNAFIFSHNHGNSKYKGSARFYGINTRFSYTLPFSNENSRYSVQAGWYIWSMLLETSNFGVDSLMGPQILLSGMWNIFDTRKFYGYLKFAPLGSGLRPSNRELAVGAGVQVNSRQASFPIFVGVDISQAQYTVEGGSSGFKLNTYSAGVSTNF